jgi:predicted lipoprotein
MAASPDSRKARTVVLAGLAVAAAGLLWIFPPFRVVSLKTQGLPIGGSAGSAAFDPSVAAAQFWQKDLPAATGQASEATQVVTALRADPAAARAKFARSSGLGTAYYFVRGRGRVVTVDRSFVQIALGGDAGSVIALRVGPVFGNTVRDGCGLLDVNSFPGLTEFNALAAELNALVEKNVIPSLREQAAVGAAVEFVGCAEAPESMPASGEPLLKVVPVKAEVLP